MKRLASVVVVVGAAAAPTLADVFNMDPWLTSLEFVTVGNPGNIGELSGVNAGGSGPDRTCGAVAYAYQIGKFEVTCAQYCEFLNAVGVTDTYGLYVRIFQRNGTPGNYTYSVPNESLNRPVEWVSWGDAATIRQLADQWAAHGCPRPFHHRGRLVLPQRRDKQ
jgi:hypothetical protein